MTTATQPAQAKKKPKVNRQTIFTVLGICLAIGTAWFIYESWKYESTDNAYVTGHLHSVSPRISGVVQEVRVKDNQKVKQGDVLVTLDPADYQAQFNEVKASTDQAQSDFERVNQLAGTKAISPQDLDKAKTDLAAAKARLQTAQLQMDYTSIVAPASGVIGRKNVEAGNRVQPGQTLMVIVQDDVWVVANFKETQLAGIKEGMPVLLEVDAVPGKKFTGHVESFSPASGNQFALLPADNSTGNFTKIVQRVGVKITFDEESIKDYRDRIRAGLSVIVKVVKH
jgi:membrane fusion protein (multidrug efflux system)